MPVCAPGTVSRTCQRDPFDAVCVPCEACGGGGGGGGASSRSTYLERNCTSVLQSQGRLPVVRGLAVSRDDLARRAVIMALMCQGQVVFEAIELAWMLDFRQYFSSEMVQVMTLAEQGLVTVSETGIEVTAEGWYFVRAVAMVFDRYLQADRHRSKFSRIL
jgi:oxygen-independent coproporphyrinogen-3 oxidase